jgi:isoleucyl-tRNA synthetase
MEKKVTLKKVEPQDDLRQYFPAQERAVLEFWDKMAIFPKLQAKNQGKPQWSFLDGPITANNPMGVHHAWGRTYKDAYQRYHAMTGHDLRYQNGFDCQGLWVEVEVEKELGLKSKRDIENLVPGDAFASIDKFVQLCKARVDKFARVQTAQSIRLGYWMDWDKDADWEKPADERRSYFTMSNTNNYTIWSFLKKCHEQGLVYRGYDSMPWCPRCAVGLSQMEMHEGYHFVTHRAVFVRFPLRQRPGENLLVWTTTPWTLTSNVAAAVNPELSYVKIKHKDQIFYLSKGALTEQRLEEEFKQKRWVDGVPKLKTLEQIFKEKGGHEVLGEISGKDMLGWTYDGPYDELPAQDSAAGYPATIAEAVIKQKWGPEESAKNIHRVIGWDAVGEKEGTGIVHIAPGCGKEDFHLGKEEKLVPIAPLNEYGSFLPGFGDLEGKPAVDSATTDQIIDTLKKKGILFAVEQYPHSYPHCWRCKTELLFRLVDEWFIDMSWRDKIMKVCHDIRWIPEFGLQRELDWLKNMGDWMISKKRFWGLALPIWVCDQCSAFEVIGGVDELKSKATAGWEKFEGHSPHRPWIDLVKTQCTKCGGTASRISDVGNPWLDAGIVPYSTLNYVSDRDYWQKWFPADFITECFPGQFRNWFYALLSMSTMMTERAPFKVLLGHALVRDEKGNEMHKSLGNSIPFEDAAEKMSADLMRWMFCRQNPSANINFGYGPADALRNKFVLKLWNTYSFFCNYARLDEFDQHEAQIPVSERPDIDRWILSDLQLLIQNAHRAFQNFDVMDFCLEAERFVDDRLSNWYVRRNRRRFWKSERGADKTAAYQTLYTVLLTLTKLFAPVMPFLTETMYENLEGGESGMLSVHLCDFPQADESLIDANLSQEMDALLRIVSLGSAVRNSVKIKVRQPLAKMIVRPANDAEARATKRFADQILEELNIKEVTVQEGAVAGANLLQFEAKLTAKTMRPKLGASFPAVESALKALSAHAVSEKMRNGETIELSGSFGSITLEAGDVSAEWKAPEGFAGVVDGGTQILVDTRISEALELEGMAREIVRHIQELRKNSKLEPEDRIELYLSTDSLKLAQAIQAHKPYIGDETLTIRWATEPLSGDVHKLDVNIDGHPLHIELKKA